MLPELDWNVPTGQDVQFVAKLTDVNVPGAHVVGTTTPEYNALAKVAARPAVGRVVDAWPNGLITHAVPATQLKQAVAPTAAVCVPEGQRRQADTDDALVTGL